MSRPEGSQAPEVFYDETEARKYNASSRMITIQAEISERAIEMLSLPPGQPAYILDVGCGTGLSGKALDEAGHFWVGCDISKSMLEVAVERKSDDAETLDLGDLCEADMGLGLPFRPGTFDGVISISALQWLCYSESNDQDPKLRLNRFFSSLYSVLKKNAKAVLQFYPENPEQAILIAQAASKVGFAGGIVIDYPNSSKAKKYYLCLSFERSYSVPTAMGTAEAITEAAGHQGGVQMINRQSAQDRRGKGGKDRKAAFKSVDWIVKKKERTKRQGKQVKTDSKYTGRKRSSGF